MTAPDRIETGKVQVGDDWPAVLIRGDHALHYAMTLQAYLAGGEGAEVNKLMHRAVLEGLAKTLASANARNGVEPVMLTRATPPAMTPEVRALVEAIEDIRDYATILATPKQHDALRAALAALRGIGGDT